MAAHVQDAIMLLGDSLTQGGFDLNGFAAKLAHVYNRRMDVLNRGFSGYNTEWALPVFEQCFATKEEQKYAPKVRLLVIWFGANDAAPPPKAQYVPLDRFRANLRTMLWTVRAPESAWYSPDTRVVLMTPPPVSTGQRGRAQRAKEPPRENDREFETTRRYAEAVSEVGKAEGVPVVDLWGRLYEAAGRDEVGLEGFLTDGLHLNEKGYAIVFEELVKAIKENYPEYHYDNLKSVFPYFDVIAENQENCRELTQKRSAFSS
ncbi:SGNH hydrolase [Trametes versicolor FP-101664 SS1]|uniref:SGNH hydrolase n=1 Tax=Trametes versicolor (strain FP-101664) TaxID=717944 RepID=UPI0004621D18|nr:SGNH hydrolase [Trametes versicolor FP-101664 SS1]EIW60746.1 SGNH hydrolase [Trametes versicolor FP-101664 SS1]